MTGLPVLGWLWLVGAIGDRLWFALDHSIPSWDQAEYLTGALNYWRALQTPQWFSSDWWTHLWQLSSKIPPLVYIVTAPFISFFGAGTDQSTLVNLLFSVILLGSVYAIGVCLFTVPVALWAAGFCLLMPGLYRVRLDFLLDFPLTAMVTLCFACLTIWRENGKKQKATVKRLEPKPSFILHPSSFIRSDWLLPPAIGIALGLALMVKQPALLFLCVPLVWAGLEALWHRAWLRWLELIMAVCLSALVWLPWYRTNWLLMLSATKRATVDSAIAEGDPSLLSLDAWTYYLKEFPGMVSLPLLLVPLVGFLFFWRRSRVSSQCSGDADFAPKTRTYRQQAYLVSQDALRWLLVYCVGGYLLSSLNINKDDRYVVPYLPIVSLILAYGIHLIPRRWKLLQWGTVGLVVALMVSNLIPLPLGSTPRHNASGQHLAYRGEAYPHAQIIDSIIQAEPYLQSTVGVLPSTGQINQHNINYYGNVRDFQVYGRQVGTQDAQVEQDQRSFPWFITKTGAQGSIRQPAAQTALMQQIEHNNFKLHQSWTLPDRSTLKLFRRRIPLLEVEPIIGEQKRDRAGVATRTGSNRSQSITLEQVIVPEQAPPGKPIPITYRWSGDWSALRSGLVLLTWHQQNKQTIAGRWFHDHGLGMGLLHPNGLPVDRPSRFQVTERTSMLPPDDAPAGTYTLEALYLDRQTGKTSTLATPAVSIRINPKAAASPAPALDLLTQLRTLSKGLPQGGTALSQAIDEIGRINQYDPTQDYVEQARQALMYRVQQEPSNRDFAYMLALANVLKRRMNPAIAALRHVVQLDAQNPYAYGYLAFVNLYDFRAHAAHTALTTALKLNPTLPELYVLNSATALMRGNLKQAWQQFQVFEQLEKNSKARQ